MGVIVLIIIGSAMGWLISVATGSEGIRSVSANMALGTAGAALTAFVANQPFGGGDVVRGEFSAAALGLTFLGAVAALAIVQFLRPASPGQGTHSLRRD